MKNITMTAEVIELVAEVRLKKADMDAVSEIRTHPGVLEISVMRSVGGSVL